MRRYGFIFILAVLLILSTSSTASDNNNNHNDVLGIIPEHSFFESNTIHAPIRIDNNTDFDDQALAEGWEGYGNSTHPYIIEGYNITSNRSCIYIWSSRYLELSHFFCSPGSHLQLRTGPRQSSPRRIPTDQSTGMSK